MVISCEAGTTLESFHCFHTNLSSLQSSTTSFTNKNVWFSIIEKEKFKKEDKWLCSEIVIERCKIGDNTAGGADRVSIKEILIASWPPLLNTIFGALPSCFTSVKSVLIAAANEERKAAFYHTVITFNWSWTVTKRSLCCVKCKNI